MLLSSSLLFLSATASLVLAVPVLEQRQTCSRPANFGGPKRGLAYNTAGFTKLFGGSKIGWAYNWAQTSNGLGGFAFVPMMWGAGSASTWARNAEAAIAAGSRYLLGFNEPDNTGQANMDPQTAANVWRQNIEPFRCMALLGAPAVTNGPAPMGLAWLKSFLGACNGCTIDFVPIHWYDSATNVAYFQNYMQEAYQAGGGRPIWITEFGFVNSSEEQITDFLRQMLPWLDEQEYIHRYSYFMADNVQGLLPLVAPNGAQLSNVGQVYNTQ